LTFEGGVSDFDKRNILQAHLHPKKVMNSDMITVKKSFTHVQRAKVKLVTRRKTNNMHRQIPRKIFLQHETVFGKKASCLNRITNTPPETPMVHPLGYTFSTMNYVTEALHNLAKTIL